MYFYKFPWVEEKIKKTNRSLLSKKKKLFTKASPNATLKKLIHNIGMRQLKNSSYLAKFCTLFFFFSKIYFTEFLLGKASMRQLRKYVDYLRSVWDRSIIKHIWGKCELSSIKDNSIILYEDNAAYIRQIKDDYIEKET